MLPSRGDQVKPCSLRGFLIIFEVTFAVIKIENELSFPFIILPNAVIGLRILFFDRTALYFSQFFPIKSTPRYKIKIVFSPCLQL